MIIFGGRLWVSQTILELSFGMIWFIEHSLVLSSNKQNVRDNEQIILRLSFGTTKMAIYAIKIVVCLFVK